MMIRVLAPVLVVLFLNACSNVTPETELVGLPRGDQSSQKPKPLFPLDTKAPSPEPSENPVETPEPANFFAVVNSYKSNEVVANFISPSNGQIFAGEPTPSGDDSETRDPWKIIAHPSKLYVYALNHRSKNISSFSLNPHTGSLDSINTDCNDFEASFAFRPRTGLIHPNGEYLYVAEQYGAITNTEGEVVHGSFHNPVNQGKISVFKIDSATGCIESLVSQSSPFGNQLEAMRLHEQRDSSGAIVARRIYIADDSADDSLKRIHIFDIENSGASLSNHRSFQVALTGDSARHPEDIQILENKDMMLVSFYGGEDVGEFGEVQTYQIRADGLLEAITGLGESGQGFSSLTSGSNTRNIALHPSQKYVVVSNAGDAGNDCTASSNPECSDFPIGSSASIEFFKVFQDGSLSRLQIVPTPNRSLRRLQFDLSGEYLFAADFYQSGYSIYRVQSLEQGMIEEVFSRRDSLEILPGENSDDFQDRANFVFITDPTE